MAAELKRPATSKAVSRTLRLGLPVPEAALMPVPEDEERGDASAAADDGVLGTDRMLEATELPARGVGRRRRGPESAADSWGPSLYSSVGSKLRDGIGAAGCSEGDPGLSKPDTEELAGEPMAVGGCAECSRKELVRWKGMDAERRMGREPEAEGRPCV